MYEHLLKRVVRVAHDLLRVLHRLLVRRRGLRVEALASIHILRSSGAQHLALLIDLSLLDSVSDALNDLPCLVHAT